MASADVVSAPSGNGSVRLSVFPTEEPTVEEVITYLDANEPLVNAVHSFELRGITPPVLLSLEVSEDMTGFALAAMPPPQEQPQQQQQQDPTQSKTPPVRK